MNNMHETSANSTYLLNTIYTLTDYEDWSRGISINVSFPLNIITLENTRKHVNMYHESCPLSSFVPQDIKCLPWN